jgi:release factor glutamine methyltransferase
MSNFKIIDLVSDLTNQLLSLYQSKTGAEQEAWWLLEKLTGQHQSRLLAQVTLELSDDQCQQLQEWVNQRVKQHKPLQYILGSVPFGGLEILVSPPILIPRPETEEMVEWVIKNFYRAFPAVNFAHPEEHTLCASRRMKILDLCTGSGCIALALARAYPQAKVVGIDINPQAIALAQKNKQHNQLENVSFLISNMYDALDTSTPYDLIISNPPYITPRQYEQLEPSVKAWEDPHALVADDHGLQIYKIIFSKVMVFLKPGGQLVLELGTEIQPIVQMAQQQGMTRITLHQDMQGKQRWISAIKP